VGALADALTDAGYDMLLTRVDAERLDTAATLYDSGKAIGIIIIGQWRHHDQLNAMAARQVPLVVWGCQLPQQLYCSVGGDNVAGGLQATQHLLRQGRKRIVFLGDAQLPEVQMRWVGYQQALHDSGLEADPKLELPVPFEIVAAREALDRLCASGTPFDGIFACSDLLALQGVQAVRAWGRGVPSDVAVVGYDDMPLATWSDPPLTTVHQPVDLAGKELVDALMALMRGERATPRMLPVHLVVRHSAPAIVV
jgi:DNA-binding LacI/PurR family transcriptional regulator